MLRLALENALNLLITRGAIKLDALENSTIAVHVSDIKLSLHFVCMNSRIHVLESQQQNADVDISLNKSALISLFKGKNLKELLANDDVVISGNVKIAQALSELFTSTAIDIEELISHYTGDIVAHQLGKVARFVTKEADKDLFSVVETLKDDLSTLLVAPTRSRFFTNGTQ